MMANRSGVGRADLLAVLDGGGEEGERLAAKLGFKRHVTPEPAKKDTRRKTTPESTNDEAIEPIDDVSESHMLSSVPFYAPTYLELFGRQQPKHLPTTRGDASWAERPRELPPMPPLASITHLSAQLTSLIAPLQPFGAIDVDATVERLASCSPMSDPPLKERQRAPSTLRIVLDRRPHLTPIFQDQRFVELLVSEHFPNTEIGLLQFQPTAGIFTDCETLNPVAAENGDETWLALTDFGAFSGEVENTAPWREVADRLDPGRAVALVTAPDRAIPRDIRARWTCAQWEERTYLKRARAELERLLILLSPAKVVSTGLVRALRTSLPHPGPVEIEHRVVMHPDFAAPGADVLEFRNERREARLQQFEKANETDRAIALDVIRRWRKGDPRLEHLGVFGRNAWFAEFLELSPASRELSPRPEDHHDACAHFASFVERANGQGLPLTLRERAYISQVGSEARQAWKEPAFAKAAWAVKAEEGFSPPPEADQSHLDLKTPPLGRMAVHQNGSDLMLAAEHSGSAFGFLPTDDGIITLDHVEPPPFPGARLEFDGFGKFLTFDLNGVEVKMRWCPPGEFKMGSPEEETGRFSDEGPQVDVTIEDGFWMMEAPVTQALYEAVTGDNPSYFKSPDRPVESVSWKDAKGFAEKLNARLPGAELDLPSEAQWEYACRAETKTALWTGAIEIEGEYNAPALDPIAWYGGNSGVDFDLDNGLETRDWSEKQYPHIHAGTRPVKQKAPNPWGLYDTLGNVLEWCEDVWSESHEGASSNGSARQVSQQGGEQVRVLRGGSWNGDARNCRAGSRDRDGPELRSLDFGFRLARGQARAQVGRAERAIRRDEAGRAAEPRPAQSGGPIQQLLDRLIAAGDHGPALEKAQKEVDLADTKVISGSATIEVLGLALVGLAETLLGSSKATQALDVAQSAVRYLSNLTDNAEQYMLANALADLSLAQLGIGNPEEALITANKSVTILQRLDIVEALSAGLANALGAQLASLLALGRTEDAKAVAHQIIDLALHDGPGSAHENTLSAASAALIVLDRRKEALTMAERAIERLEEVANRDADDLSSGPFFGLLKSIAILVQTLKAMDEQLEFDGSTQPDCALQRDRVTTSKTARFSLPDRPFVLKTDRAELMVSRLTLDDLAWAKAAGRDRFGLWATCRISEQKMRWIPPGHFRLGSPADEEGRFDNEGPQTPITLARGYWLADAPITVAQFRHFVEESGYDMGQGAFGWTGTKYDFSKDFSWQNPGFDQEETAPVTCVNWHDAQAFAAWLNQGQSDDEVWHLPSEAAWEYACRAGTTTAIWSGALQIAGTNNAADLDPLAWYGGKSGLGYEGKRGVDSQKWPQKQYDHSQAGTHGVRSKAANPWGLYDTLGNVWEWCEDVWQKNHEGAWPNGSARQGSKQDRERLPVLRGGSWNSDARNCRAASRDGVVSGYRNDSIGFRLARGQARAQASPGAERPPWLAGSERAAEPPPDQRGLSESLRSIFGFGNDNGKDG